MEKKPVSYFIPGIILGLVSVILFLVYFFLGLTFRKDFINFIPALISFALIIYFVIKWANDNDNNVTFGQCFGYGFKSVMIMALIVFFFTLIFILLFPDFKQQYIDFIRVQMDENKTITDEQKEQGVAMVSKFFMISTLGGGLFFNLLIGAIASLIGSAIAKKNPQTPFSQQF